MALLHPMEVNNTGLAAEYWRITHRSDDYAAGVITAQVHGYATRDTRAAGKAPMTAVQFRLSLSDLPETSDLHAVTTAHLYVAIKRRSAAAREAQGALGAEVAPPIFDSAILADAIDC